jgi:hypothetical protein
MLAVYETSYDTKSASVIHSIVQKPAYVGFSTHPLKQEKHLKMVILGRNV